MIKKFIIPIFLLFSIVSMAQQATSSPYSFYGIGDVRFKGTVENRLMGGISIFPDSIHINIQNPASLSYLKLTSFTVGGGFQATKFNSYKGDEKAQRTTLDYLAVGVPLGKKAGLGFGLIPYSAVGYRIRTTDDTGVSSPIGTIRRYEGKGGLNKVYAGYSYQFTTHFSLGASVNYNFGNVETTDIKYIPDVQYGALESNTSQMSGFNFNFGAMYQHKISNNTELYGSLTYTPESDLKSTNVRTLSNILYSEDFDPTIYDSNDSETSKTTLKLPSTFAVGLGFGQAKKWLIGSEITLQQSSGMKNRFSDVNNTTFENAVKYSFGGYYVPNYTSFSNYFKKVTYRAGFRYENTGLVIRNESIKDYAYTLGFGLPMSGTFSNLNLGLEFGKRGTAKANLVQENYTNVIISLSLNDKWFVKRKYD